MTVLPSELGAVMSLIPLLSLPVDLTLITRRVLKNTKRKLENLYQMKISGFSSYNKTPYEISCIFTLVTICYTIYFHNSCPKILNMSLYFPSSNKNC